MRRALSVPALFAAAFVGFDLFVAGPGSGPGSAASAFAAEKGAGLEEFMLVVHGPKGLRTQIKEALGGGGPSDDKAWKAVRAEASIVSFLTESILEKASPPKGDKASWKSKVGEYSKIVKALATAADEKDASAMNAELGKLSKGCEGCHKAHR